PRALRREPPREAAASPWVDRILAGDMIPPGGPVMSEKWRTWGVAALSFVAAVAAPGGERDPRIRLHEVLDQRREAFAPVAREIWGFAEVGYQEEKSSALLQSQLKGAGFEVRSGVAGIP